MPSRRKPQTEQEKLTVFATQAVRAAQKVAATAPSGAFGDRVFTHAAWAIGKFDMPLAEFKQKLVTAHRARYLTLARADLVEAMNPYDVRRSLIEDRNSTYNFIVL